MLFNEPKLLKFAAKRRPVAARDRFSALQRAEIAEMRAAHQRAADPRGVSVLFNEPKLLKCSWSRTNRGRPTVSVLFNEPKLLKSIEFGKASERFCRFSALQRAEIAEMRR